MKKGELLRAVVIVQAVCMIVLTGVVIAKVWPILPPSDTGEGNEPVPTPSSPAKDGDSKELERKIIASIGGETIFYDQLAALLYEQYGDEALRTMMVRKAMELEAKALEIEVLEHEANAEVKSWMSGYDDEQQFYQVMKEQAGLSKQQIYLDAYYKLLAEKLAAASVVITTEEVTQYIDSHPEQFKPVTMLHIRWIVTEEKAEADHVMGLLEQGSDFAALAIEYSIDGFTADAGGDLGQIEANDPFYDSNMLKQAQRLQLLEATGPVEISDGYAIIQLMGKKVTDEMPRSKQFEEARRQLALARAKPLSKMEEELLIKYDALIVK